MQKIVFLLLFVFSATTSFSQQDFFVYIQADTHQPFYARINAKMYSSTEFGYMIIPKLSDSTYSFSIGFAKNAFPEQSFVIPINKRDKGFQLKNLGDKGWALVNLQNAATIMNSGLPLKTESEFSGIKKTDVFSTMLASVVNDSSILYSAVKPKLAEVVPEKKIPVVVNQSEEQLPQKDSAKSNIAEVQSRNEKPVHQRDSVLKNSDAVKTDSAKAAEVTVKTNTVVDPVVKNADTVKASDPDLAKKVAVEKPFITRIEEKKLNGSYEAVYLEQYNFSTDTIRISILLAEGKTVVTDPVKPVIENKAEPIPEQKNTDTEKISSLKPVVIDTVASVKRAIQITNSDCKGLATDYDVDKLRVKLISDKTIDDKLATAKKYYKTKCLSVKQLKALTELFPSDETRYRFFDTSYPFVSDTSNFYQLEELIESDYYKKRFKAMIIK